MRIKAFLFLLLFIPIFSCSTSNPTNISQLPQNLKRLSTKLTFDTSNFIKTSNTPYEILYHDTKGDIVGLSNRLHHSNQRMNPHPDPRNAQALEKLHRSLTHNPRKFVEAKSVLIDNQVWAARVIIAFPQTSGGYTFQESIQIATENECIFLKVSAVNRHTSDSRGIRWDKKYDAKYPDHPLSKVRNTSDKLIQSIKLSKEVIHSAMHKR